MFLYYTVNLSICYKYSSLHIVLIYTQID